MAPSWAVEGSILQRGISCPDAMLSPSPRCFLSAPSQNWLCVTGIARAMQEVSSTNTASTTHESCIARPAPHEGEAPVTVLESGSNPTFSAAARSSTCRCTQDRSKICSKPQDRPNGSALVLDSSYGFAKPMRVIELCYLCVQFVAGLRGHQHALSHVRWLFVRQSARLPRSSLL